MSAAFCMCFLCIKVRAYAAGDIGQIKNCFNRTYMLKLLKNRVKTMPHFNKKEIYELLNEKGVSYTVSEHPAVYTIAEMDQLGVTAQGKVCKNLFLRDAKGRNHFLVTAPEDREINLRRLSDKIGSTRLGFASAERLMKYLGVRQGAVSPFGVLNDEECRVTLVADSALKRIGKVGVHPNDNTATVWIEFSDLQKIISGHGNKIIYVDF